MISENYFFSPSKWLNFASFLLYRKKFWKPKWLQEALSSLEMPQLCHGGSLKCIRLIFGLFNLQMCLRASPNWYKMAFYKAKNQLNMRKNWRLKFFEFFGFFIAQASQKTSYAPKIAKFDQWLALNSPNQCFSFSSLFIDFRHIKCHFISIWASLRVLLKSKQAKFGSNIF